MRVRGMRTGISIEVTADDRERLLAIAGDRNNPLKHVWRCRIVLLTADGHGTAEIMRQAGVAKTAVWRWQERFMQPGLPLKRGRCGTMTHDCKRNGTTTLFAALNVLDGRVIGRGMHRHRHQEFIRFLNAVEAEVPASKAVYASIDNYAAHKHPKVVQWLARHPRWTFHFTPTSAAWLNAVEGFFAKLTKRRLKRGVFHSLVSLQAAINRFVAEANATPKPFRWTKDPDTIFAAVRRGNQALDSHH